MEQGNALPNVESAILSIAAAIAGSRRDPTVLSPDIGDLKWRPMSSAISGYLICDGTAVSRTTYSSLWTYLAPTVGTFVVTIAAPAVVTLVAHGLNTGDQVYLSTTGALPTGLVANTLYYVIKVTVDTFNLATSRANAIAGTKITTTGTQSGTHTCILCPYGLGNGSTTFNVPNLQGKVIVGVDTTSNDFLATGQTGGASTHTLSAAESGVPAHSHVERVGNGAAGATLMVAQALYNSTAGFDTNQSTQTNVGAAASSAHNNLQPYITSYCFIKT